MLYYIFFLTLFLRARTFRSLSFILVRMFLYCKELKPQRKKKRIQPLPKTNQKSRKKLNRPTYRLPRKILPNSGTVDIWFAKHDANLLENRCLQ